VAISPQTWISPQTLDLPAGVVVPAGDRYRRLGAIAACSVCPRCTGKVTIATQSARAITFIRGGAAAFVRGGAAGFARSRGTQFRPAAPRCVSVPVREEVS